MIENKDNLPLLTEVVENKNKKKKMLTEVVEPSDKKIIEESKIVLM